jgi:two-component system, cell cycle sensor histidine kinase and response regulator CckA
VTSGRHTILVVEDEPIVRNLIVDVFTRQGWLVFEADTSTEALIVCSALKDRPLDLLIVADELSPMTGHALADRILAGCPNAKILHLSAVPMLAPGVAFLQKPFSSSQLMNAVESVLNPRMQ